MSHSERPSRTRLIKTYLSLVGGPALALLVILQLGSLLTSNRGPARSTTAIGVAASQTPPAIADTPSPNPDLPLLLTQIVVILEGQRGDEEADLIRRSVDPRILPTVPGLGEYLRQLEET